MRSAIRKAMRTEEEREAAEVVALYAKLKKLEKEAAELKAEARERATDLYEGYGMAVLQGDEGVVTIKVKKPAQRIDPKAVRKFLTPEQLEECTVLGKASLQMSFTAAKEGQ